MPLYELIQQILRQQSCANMQCPFRVLQEQIKQSAMDEDPVEVIADALQYTETTARTMVRVEAHALHKLLDRLITAEKKLEEMVR